jgi:hypothetical protein
LGLPVGEESDSEDEEKRTKRYKRMKRGGMAGGGGTTRNGGTARNGVCGAKIQAEKDQVNGGESFGDVPQKSNLFPEETSTPELNGDLNKQCCTEADAIHAHHRKDDAALIHLIPADNSSNSIHRQYIRVSGEFFEVWG